MLPDFESNGNLPPGIHSASWAEFGTRFAWNEHRERLCDGLRRALSLLLVVGCADVFIDGSYVTAKEVPNDYDGAWSLAGVDLVLLKRLEPLFFEFSFGRTAQKAKFFGEFFPAEMQEGQSGKPFLSFFQRDKETGQAKGIVRIPLRTLHD
jgi:hypothetical protein